MVVGIGVKRNVSVAVLKRVQEEEHEKKGSQNFLKQRIAVTFAKNSGNWSDRKGLQDDVR